MNTPLSGKIYKYLKKQNNWVPRETIFTVAMNRGYIVPAIYDALKVLSTYVDVGIVYINGTPRYRAYDMTDEQKKSSQDALNYFDLM